MNNPDQQQERLAERLRGMAGAELGTMKITPRQQAQVALLLTEAADEIERLRQIIDVENLMELEERADRAERELDEARELYENVAHAWRAAERELAALGVKSPFDSTPNQEARYGWTQPCCEDCWERLNPGREPTRLKAPVLEKCVYCANMTTSGIYVRVDPAEAKFPSLTK